MRRHRLVLTPVRIIQSRVAINRVTYVEIPNLDWDVFINYEGEEISCGDLTEIFREEQTVDGSEECNALASELRDTCCYSSPVTSCQLCKHSGIFYEVDDKVQVDFNGPTTCKDVANFLTRRIEETDNMCITTQASYYEDFCFDKCMLVNADVNRLVVVPSIVLS